jgi:ketosteroid isomerase-like protein
VNEAENTKVALSFLAHLSDGELEAALDLIADDVVWWLAGEPEQFKIAGTKNGKAQLAEMLDTIGKGMPTGIRLTVTGVTAEGERVAVEMNADGISATGKEYHNHYHDLFEVRDGRIYAAREYLDTAHAQKIIVESIPM